MRNKLMPPKAMVLGLSVNGLSVIRSLGRMGIRAITVDRAKHDAVCHSRYMDKSYSIGFEKSESEVVNFLIKIGESLNRPLFLFPTNDYFVLLVARNREILKKYFRFVVTDAHVQEGAVNKKMLYETATRLGIACPKIYSLRSHQDVETIANQVEYPCFIKPVYSHIWREKYTDSKVLRIENKSQLIERFKEIHALDLEIMIQEIIPGGDDTIYSIVAFMDPDSQPLAVLSKQKLRQNPVGTGDGCFQVTTDDPDLKSLGVRFLQGLRYVGPACIEFRWDARDGQYKLMEINARTLAVQEMIAQAGINIPYMAYQIAMGEKVEPVMTYRVGLKWVCFEWDFSSFLQARRMGILTFGEWFRSLWGARAFAYFCWDDPIPFVIQTVSFTKRILIGCVKSLINHPQDTTAQYNRNVRERVKAT